VQVSGLGSSDPGLFSRICLANQARLTISANACRIRQSTPRFMLKVNTARIAEFTWSSPEGEIRHSGFFQLFSLLSKPANSKCYSFLISGA
jgi:hypothetical protein